MNLHRLPLALALAAVVLLELTLPAASRPATNPPPLAVLMNMYAADQADVGGAFPVPGSPSRLSRFGALLDTWQSRLKELPFDTLSRTEQVDYLLIRRDIESGLADLAREQQQWEEMTPFMPFRAGIYTLTEARLKGSAPDYQASAGVLGQIPGDLKSWRERIDRGIKTNTSAAASGHSATGLPLILSAPLANQTAQATDGLRSALKAWFTAYDGYSPEFRWWIKKPYEEADKALEDYARYLREEVAGIKGKADDPLIGRPAGKTALAGMLKTEFIAYDPDELLTLGRRELAWCEQEMKTASRALGCGDDWKAALARVKADFVPPGEQPALIISQAREAITFIRSRDLVTVPPLCEDTWMVSMMTPETLKTIPYAAYQGQTMMVAYSSEAMTHDEKLMTMRGNNRHFTRTVTPHELIPGHHLQRFQSSRLAPRRTGFSTPFHVEGWALYWERRLWDLGWASTPEDRLGMLFWRMTRAARVETSLRFHSGSMTPDEAIEFLVSRVGHERLCAAGEIRRLMEWSSKPLYQAAYLIGALQLEALRREVVDKGILPEREFHDAVLAANAIPVELIRDDLLNLPLSRESQPEWSFAPPRE